MKKHITVILALLLSITISAEVGSWQVYLSYPSTESITQSENKVYAYGSGSMFSLDKSDNSVEAFSILNGLSESEIKQIKFSENDNMLVIVYSNSNIDLLTTKGFYNLSEFKNKDMTGSKRINNIMFTDGYAYLSADYGLMKVNLKKKEFSDTYHPTSTANILDATYSNDKLYAMTEDSVFFANASDKILADPTRWTSIADVPEKYIDNKQLASFDNQIFLLKADSSLYSWNEEEKEWKIFDQRIISMQVSLGKFNTTGYRTVKTYSSLSDEPMTTTTTYDITDAVYDNSQKLLYSAALTLGLGKTYEDGDYTFYSVNGPRSSDAYTMKYVNGRLFIITIGTWVDGSNSTEGINGMVMIYDGENWKNIATQGFADLMDIAIDPSDNTHFFVGSYALGGLFEFRNDEFYMRHNHEDTNNIIEDVFGNDMYIILDALNYDENGDLWMMQMCGAYPVKVLRHDGTWEQYKNFTKVNGSSTLMRGNMIDANGSKWVFSPRSNFIFVYDTSNNRQVYRTSFTDQDGNKFSSARFRCAVADRENPQEIWLGSLSGPIIVPNAKNFYSSDLIKRIKIPRNDGTGLADYLLANEAVNYIAVDAANRKWIATRTSGVYLVSPDGTETIEHFTSANSPLLGDNVYTIAINSENGEVFFCTENGICSYKGDAIDANDSFDDVHAYPNPVREDYEGVISIVGLVENSNVKITDISGNMVYETVSKGGMATWDGTDKSGERVATGIYLAMCYSETTKKSTVCKILIVNK